LEFESDNWQAHENKHGCKFIAFMPTGATVAGDLNVVVLAFCDEDAGVGVQVVLPQQRWQEFVMMVVKARETIEAKQEYEEGDDE
jgi:hypothetical protein